MPYKSFGVQGKIIRDIISCVCAGSSPYLVLNRSKKAKLSITFIPLLKYWRPSEKRKCLSYVEKILTQKHCLLR